MTCDFLQGYLSTLAMNHFAFTVIYVIIWCHVYLLILYFSCTHCFDFCFDCIILATLWILLPNECWSYQWCANFCLSIVFQFILYVTCIPHFSIVYLNVSFNFMLLLIMISYFVESGYIFTGSYFVCWCALQ